MNWLLGGHHGLAGVQLLDQLGLRKLGLCPGEDRVGQLSLGLGLLGLNVGCLTATVTGDRVLDNLTPLEVPPRRLLQLLLEVALVVTVLGIPLEVGVVPHPAAAFADGTQGRDQSTGAVPVDAVNGLPAAMRRAEVDGPDGLHFLTRMGRRSRTRQP
jgi:hypothetical protein